MTDGIPVLTGPEKVIFDVDTGIDDALALLLALRLGADVLGIGVVGGNADVARCVTNTLVVLEVGGYPTVPVAAGCSSSVKGYPFKGAPHIQGRDALGDRWAEPALIAPSSEHAVDQLLRITSEHPGGVTLIATAPLTNVASAIGRDPLVSRRLRRIVAMGGAVNVPGNVTAVAEANFWNDPEAAATVLASGCPITLVGLDATTQVILDEEGRTRLADSDDPAARFAAAISRDYVGYYRARGDRGCFLHDPLAVGVALMPEIVLERCDFSMSVELDGTHTRGMAVVDHRRSAGSTEWSRVDVPVRIDSDLFLERFMIALGAGRPRTPN